MSQTRFMRIERNEVVTSRERSPVPFDVPPVAFQGDLEIGPSGVWHPPRKIELLNGVCTSHSPGTALAGFAVMRRTVLTPEGEALKGFLLGATATQTVFSMYRFLQPAIITPQDGLFVISFAASGHTNVTIRFGAIEVD